MLGGTRDRPRLHPMEAFGIAAAAVALSAGIVQTMVARRISRAASAWQALD